MSMDNAECTNDQDCKLIDNCCECSGSPKADPVKVCNIKCKAAMCTTQQLQGSMAQCEVGRCVAGFDCRWANVTCKKLQPQCKPGETNSVIGTCWGPCVPATQCEFVSTCKQCDTNQACVNKQAKIGGGRHCVALPKECNGTATCACMGKSVCLKPHDTCSDKAGEITCSCPTC